MQFLTGAQIRNAQIPFLPSSAQVIAGWFNPLPLVDDAYYLPGALMCELDLAAAMDGAAGLAAGFQGVLISQICFSTANAIALPELHVATSERACWPPCVCSLLPDGHVCRPLHWRGPQRGQGPGVFHQPLL